MSLNLNPDIEARLIALAHSSGVSVDDFLLHVVEEKSGAAETIATRLRASTRRMGAEVRGMDAKSRGG
jgi:hypothetical protein